MRALAAALAGLAAAFAVSGRPNLLRARLGPRHVHTGPAGGTPAAPLDARTHPWRRRSGIRIGVAAAVGGLTGLVVGGAALAVIGSAAAATALAGHTRATTARRQAEHDAAVTEACVMLAAELRAGAHPRQALSAVAAQWPALFGRAARQAAEGGEVGPALRAAAGERWSALSAVAAGWEVSERTGAVLSDVLTAIADSLRADAAARREAMAQLSTVRVTARLLAVLPVGTLLLLSGGGGAALQFLLRSPYGQGCLVGAALLTAAGLWWVDRLAGSATER